MYGGPGADTFVFEAAAVYSNIDVIKDFSILDGYKINLLTELLTDEEALVTNANLIV